MLGERDYQIHDLPPEKREDLLRALGERLAQRAEVAFAYAHGSFVAGGPFRDLDVAVYLRSGPSGPDFPYEDRLAQELEETPGLPCPVDVRVANHAPIPFQYHACRGRLLADRDPEFRAATVARVVGRYLDLEPVLRHHAREAFGSDPGR